MNLFLKPFDEIHQNKLQYEFFKYDVDIINHGLLGDLVHICSQQL